MSFEGPLSAAVIIVDIDGTIANMEHRLHFIKRDRPDWDAFHDHVSADTPYWDMIELVRGLRYGCGVSPVLVTGRMERCRPATEKWLATHGVPWERLFMRKEGDFRPDYEVKEEILDTKLEGLLPERILFALDDRDQIVEMWRRIGIRCLQVKDGDY